MLAARWHGRGDVRVEQIPDLGSPPAGWVRIAVEACGICGTDVEEYTSGPIVVCTTPNPLSGRCAPLTLGHEAVGVVVEAGDGVELPVGTRVAIEGNMFCGSCFWCLRHDYQLCPSLASLGLMGDGGLAEQMLAPAFMCIPFSNAVEASHAALAEPLSVAVRAARRGGIGLGSTVAVLGAGTVGLLCIQAARLAGADTIIAVERHALRRKLAIKLGADLAVTPEEAAEACADSTSGIGPDITLEVAGNPAAGASAVSLVRRGGTAVLLGVYSEPLELDMMDLLLGEKTIVASLSHVYDDDFQTAVNLIDQERIELEPLISEVIPLADVVTKGFERLVADPASHLKMIVSPNDLT